MTITAGATVSQFVEVPKVVAETGQLQIRSEPSGARVVVDGTPRGAAPVTVENLGPGSHSVEVSNENGSVRQEITVAAGTTSSLVVPMQSRRRARFGIHLELGAGGNADLRGRPAGRQQPQRSHHGGRRPARLEIVNEALGYRATRTVNVAPGQVATVKPDWPKGSMAINAQPWAEVFIDGERVGETPIGSVPVPIGTHEVGFRHPELGEQAVRVDGHAGNPGAAQRRPQKEVDS